MILSTILTALTILPLQGALCGQIPIDDNGIIGGVLKTTTDSATFKEADLSSSSGVTTTPGKLRVVEKSGVCETTQNVYQASGYCDLTATKSIWFWFFAARNKPDKAPLALWFNGGPGSSSMIGLFQEHGPCRITNDSSSVTLNPFSWNNNANVLYIDQPVGVGFSHGDLDVGTSHQAAVDIWTFLQIFFSDARFKSLAENDLAIWTESYGGHYGPVFASHFLSQNAAIAAGTTTGIHLNLKVLGVGNGLTDPLSQYPGYIQYAANNSYHQLVSDSTISKADNAWTSSNGCRDQVKACNNGGSDAVCSKAQDFCNTNVMSPLSGPYNVYYVPMKNPDPYPASLEKYLNNDSFRSKIGAETNWQQTNYDVYYNFSKTGDWMRSTQRHLETVIDSGIYTIIYDGDADYILNYMGEENMVDNLDTKYSAAYRQQKFQDYTIAGKVAGLFKNAGTFSYLRVYGAGHEVPAYKYRGLEAGEAALQMFEQIMAGQSLIPT